MRVSSHEDSGPLPLFQLLENEYRLLHGPLPDAYLSAKERIERQSVTEEELNEALMTELYTHIHAKEAAALCLSGGGIRSATFGLGVLQGLARHDLLDRFHYLSTVSGGGYVGSWLTSWIHRKGLSSVLAELKNPPPSKLCPEPKAIRHLREYSNYLTPQLGTLSADTWTLLATYLRNLFINWFVWVPLLIAALTFPRFIVLIAAYHPGGRRWLLTAALLSGFALVGFALAYISLNLPSVRSALQETDHVFRNRGGQENFLKWSLTPLMLSAFLLTTAWAWLRNAGTPLSDQFAFVRDIPSWVPFLFLGMLVHVFGWLIASALLLRVGTWARFIASLQAIGKFRNAYHSSAFHAILLSGAAGGLATWFSAVHLFPNLNGDEPIAAYACFGAPLLLFAFLVAGAVYVGLASHWTTDDDREWWARSSAWILIALTVWAALGVVVVFGPVWLLSIPQYLVPLGGTTGLLTLLLGFSTKTVAIESAAEKRGWQALLLKAAPILAAPIALLLLAAGLALVTTWLLSSLPGTVSAGPHHESVPPLTDPALHLLVLHHTNGWPLSVFTTVLVLLAVAAAWLINVNKFSLHAIYRNRLIRAYLGASNEQRRPDAFTGFDPEDNIEMYRLVPAPPSPPRLFHVVNMALNLVGGKKEALAWQERKAESFTVSPLHAGNWRLGYRSSLEYGRNRTGKAITLGTAISISGAAASPNMGYHSSPPVTFLMTLFNVRLGWWLGNPGKAGRDTYRHSSPSFSILPMIQEAFGFTNDENPYIYLSDGGHFENLGLYEMVLRHCRFILAIDAGRDPDCAFADLGNAVRKIRIDLGIPVTLQKVRIYARNSTTRKAGDIPKYCAVGTIGYSRLDPREPNGILIYLKPALCEDEPLDIYNYAQTNPEFPHESTGDQWFSESQFESYRMLGSHIIEQICGQDWEERYRSWIDDPENRDRSRLDFFFSQVQRYLERRPDDELSWTTPMANGDTGRKADSRTAGPGIVTTESEWP